MVAEAVLCSTAPNSRRKVLQMGSSRSAESEVAGSRTCCHRAASAAGRRLAIPSTKRRTLADRRGEYGSFQSS